MLRFNAHEILKNFIRILISIHPMLRFNSLALKVILYILRFQYILCYGSTDILFIFGIKNRISIHPMLRFNTLIISNLGGKIKISIHPMLRFNDSADCNAPAKERFQYILCYGSTELTDALIKQQEKFQYILCYGSTNPQKEGQETQNHFNTSYVTVQRLRRDFGKIEFIKFQYILCYGST